MSDKVIKDAHIFANKADERFWKGLPDDIKKKLSIHDLNRIAKPFLEEIERLRAICEPYIKEHYRREEIERMRAERRQS